MKIVMILMIMMFSFSSYAAKGLTMHDSNKCSYKQKNGLHKHLSCDEPNVTCGDSNGSPCTVNLAGQMYNGQTSTSFEGDTRQIQI